MGHMYIVHHGFQCESERISVVKNVMLAIKNLNEVGDYRVM
jgi:hypothetical protein